MAGSAVLLRPHHRDGGQVVRTSCNGDHASGAAAVSRRQSSRALLIVFAILLGGCATLAPETSLHVVEDLTKEHTGQDLRWNRPPGDAAANATAVQDALTRPLSVNDAVRIALLNNRRLQATYAELGIADADAVSAHWLRNPTFAFSHLQGGGIKEIERSFALDIAGLVTMPLTIRMEQDRLSAMQLAVATRVLELAAQTRSAYFQAVAAAQTARYMEQVQVAADASAELAQRMVKAGNWNRLDQAREKTFYVEATAQVSRARHAALAARESLVRLLGLSHRDAALRLPDRLPDLPSTIAVETDVTTGALKNRLDVRAATQDTTSLAASLGLTKATRFVNVLEVGYKTKSDSGVPLKRGYEIALEIPLFDWSGAKVAKAEYLYMQSVDRTAEVAINAESEVREAYSAYRTAFDLARQYRDELVPLRKQISDENQLRYNGMLISVFELIADAREQVLSVNASIEALRDFWLASSHLDSAVYVGTVEMTRADTRSDAAFR